MDDKSVVNQEDQADPIEAGQPVPLPATQPKAEPIELSFGYVVGVNGSGQFVFKPVGDQNGIVQLLGLHAYAGRRIDMMLDEVQGTGEKLIRETARAVASIGASLAKLGPNNRL